MEEGVVGEGVEEEEETESGRGSAPMLQLLSPLPEPPSPFTRAGEVVITPMTSLSLYSMYSISWSVYCTLAKHMATQGIGHGM